LSLEYFILARPALVHKETQTRLLSDHSLDPSQAANVSASGTRPKSRSGQWLGQSPC